MFTLLLWHQLAPLDRTCSALLLLDFIGEKKRKDKMKNVAL
jgi:hypothetical protein